jgi:ATP-dependent RNA helicase RhlE
MLFSATLPREIENLTRRLMHSPVRIEIGEERVAEPVSQEAWPVAARQKYALLIAILQRRGWKRVLIFCRTRARAEKLHERLVAEGMPSGILHADRPMADRRSVMLAFRGGEIQYLVATDLAARGLDIAEIDHVVNFDVPVAPEDYIHRVGRTGRAGQPGVALSLVSDAELVLLTRIEYRLHYQIPVKRLDDFVYDSEVAGATRKIRSRERKPTDPNARLFSTERKESPFTRTGKARRATNIERGDATKPARIKKKLPHQRRRRG